MQNGPAIYVYLLPLYPSNPLYMPKFLGSGFVLLSLFSCQAKKAPPGNYSKDSVVHKYLHLLDSSENADSNDLKYKILKNYLADDSGFFINLDRNLDIYKQEMDNEQRVDSCLDAARLSAKGFEEVYRFYWSGAFCYHRLMITVGKQPNGVLLDFVEYQYAPDNQFPCRVTRRMSKPVSGEAWDHLKNTIQFAYFWSMEPHEDNLSLDGSDWKVEGFTAARFHSVYRHSPGVRAFSAIGFEMLKLSGQKTHCFY